MADEVRVLCDPRLPRDARDDGVISPDGGLAMPWRKPSPVGPHSGWKRKQEIELPSVSGQWVHGLTRGVTGAGQGGTPSRIRSGPPKTTPKTKENVVFSSFFWGISLYP